MALITFSSPVYLWFLLAIPLLVMTHFFTLKYVKRRALRFANFEALGRVSGGQALSKNIMLLILRLTTLLFLILSAAGIIFWYTGQSSNYNYVLAIDASGSMLASDLEPNRLAAAKEAATAFVDSIEGRVKVGIVSFSGVGVIEERLLEDRKKVKDAISSIEIKTISGTAIGDALKASTNLLLTEDKANIIILLTDGRENVATQEELDKVIDIVQENLITVHTIGVGTQEGGLLPGVEAVSSLDESTLRRIAEQTSGRFFVADDTDALHDAYTTILSSGEANLPVKLSIPFMLIALALLFVEWGLVNTKYRTIP